MSRSSTAFILIVLIVLAGAFLGFTGSGHNLLRQMGVMTACGSSDCGSN